MTRLLLIAVLVLAGLPVRAAERQVVPASALVTAAKTMLESQASVEKIDATFALVSHVEALSLLAAGEVRVLAAPLKAPWLRPRVGVPVRVTSADGRSSSVTVWFSVTAPTQGNVYGSNYARGTPAAQIRMQPGAVDLARTHGQPSASVDSVGELRLRHAVTATAAVLADDFESVPAVQAQEPIRIEVGTGVVHLSTRGRALSDGAIGQIISVLPANASQPVRARVVSDQVVTIEN